MAKKQKPNKETNETGFVGARIPNGLKAKLERKAAREKRSASAELTLALEAWTAHEP